MILNAKKKSLFTNFECILVKGTKTNHVPHQKYGLLFNAAWKKNNSKDFIIKSMFKRKGAQE